MRRGTSIAAGIIWAAVVVVIVAAAAGLTWWLAGREHTATAGTASPAPATRPHAASGRDYYLIVRLVEFTPRTPSGRAWDTDGSAPDARVHIEWRGNRVFSLPPRDNALIAAWDLFKISINPQDLLKLKDMNFDPTSAINGPIVTAGPGETVTIEVRDDDPVSYDLALRMTVRLSDLREGANDIPVPPNSGVRRLRIDLLPRDMPLDELLRRQIEGK